MSRVLSELLGAKEPFFSLSLRQMEQRSGKAGADIRLSSEVARGARTKLKGLGLDPLNTTGEELYAALRQRLVADDERLTQALYKQSSNKISSDSDTLIQVAKILNQVPIPKTCFALKNPVAKKILKATPPKRVMKLLGYRSLDSMLKHEAPASLIAVSWIIETAIWRQGIMARYRKLQSTDFEVGAMNIIHPSSKRWQALSASLVPQTKHHIIGVRELGAVVILPLPSERPPIATLTTLVLALQAMNEIRSASTYLKMRQVKANFGVSVQAVVAGEPRLSTHLLDQPVSWHVIQRYYARFSQTIKRDVFEPHIQAEDLSWHSVEKVLSHIEPGLEFWRHTTNLALLHNHQPVSLNIIDVALNACNGLPYQSRIVHYFRRNLWHELSLRYLNHDRIEQSVLAELQTELASEPSLN